MTTVVGQSVRRREDPRFLRGEGHFVDDLRIPGALHVTFIRSPWAHARVLRVDGSAASELPDTEAFTAADMDLPAYPAPPFLGLGEEMHRPLLAGEKVRFVGDIVAAVTSTSREASVDAAELVEVEYEPLAAITDPAVAARDELLLFEEHGTNVCFRQPAEGGEDLFAGCEVVTSGTIVSPRLAACPIEPRATIAQFDDDGRLTIWLSTQTPHQDKAMLESLFGLEPHQVRVIAPDVGGGFGGKALDVEDALVVWLSRKTGRPVRWTETRSEHMVAMHHGRAQRLEFTIGGSSAGEVTALRCNVL
ncbi:MAG: xanthine dehydrogenase family protein molybdopterin-binding subunit, partial [Solirubrobacterales bacterium]|nr:xanthine dehydrogenase family protein molybdopterin-binding subunit [Solirubrobacterales bacterium]